MFMDKSTYLQDHLRCGRVSRTELGESLCA